MNISRNAMALLAVSFALAIAASVSVGALASAQIVEGNIRPFVVDISQAVPVDISAPIELDSGDVITVTAPMTITIELRVSVDGQGIATVVEDALEEPEVKVTETVAKVPRDVVQIGSLAWRITSQENLGQAFEWNSLYSFETSGNFIRLYLEAENLGNIPVHFSPYGGGTNFNALLLDEHGRQFAELDYGREFDELCWFANINPGMTAKCVMVFDVPEDVKSLVLELTIDRETAEFPLLPQRSGLQGRDHLGIPYAIEMESSEIEIAEWTVFADTNNQFNIAGELTLNDDSEPFQSVVAEVSFYNASDELIERDDISGVDFRLGVDGYSRFNSRFGIDVDDIDHYAVSFKTVR